MTFTQRQVRDWILSRARDGDDVNYIAKNRDDNVNDDKDNGDTDDTADNSCDKEDADVNGVNGNADDGNDKAKDNTLMMI